MKFTVPVVRISYQFKDIEVDADTQEAADNAALDEAGNHLYSEKNVEYALADGETEVDKLKRLLNEVRDACGRAQGPKRGPYKSTLQGCLEVFDAIVTKIDAAL